MVLAFGRARFLSALIHAFASACVLNPIAPRRGAAASGSMVTATEKVESGSCRSWYTLLIPTSALLTVTLRCAHLAGNSSPDQYLGEINPQWSQAYSGRSSAKGLIFIRAEMRLHHFYLLYPLNKCAKIDLYNARSLISCAEVCHKE
jgi:hypothetical protein